MKAQRLNLWQSLKMTVLMFVLEIVAEKDVTVYAENIT